jgi:hypothetical protein
VPTRGAGGLPGGLLSHHWLEEVAPEHLRRRYHNAIKQPDAPLPQCHKTAGRAAASQRSSHQKAYGTHLRLRHPAMHLNVSQASQASTNAERHFEVLWHIGCGTQHPALPWLQRVTKAMSKDLQVDRQRTGSSLQVRPVRRCILVSTPSETTPGIMRAKEKRI